MTTGERMRARRKDLGLSAEDVAKMLNVSRATIYRYEKGDIEKVPGQVLEPLSYALHTTPAYLMGWDENPDAPYSDDKVGLCYVQYVGPVAAHFNATPTEEHEIRYIPSEWLNRRQPKDFFVASVNGNSMYPHFHEGDEILCLRCSDMGHSGRIGIIVFGDGEATLKRIDYQPGEDWIDLVPINPEYMTTRIEGADLEQARIVGRVIKVIRTVDEA